MIDIKYIWKHRKEIVEGWINFLKLKYLDKFAKHSSREEVIKVIEIETLSNKRLHICKTCPYRKSLMERDAGKVGPVKEVEDDQCGLCGCPLKAKTLAMSQAKWGEGGCPKKLW